MKDGSGTGFKGLFRVNVGAIGVCFIDGGLLSEQQRADTLGQR